MVNFRLYRLSFLPALLAIVIGMFSLEGTPEALEPVTPATTFEGDRAAAIARQIATTAPDRTPGSADDGAVADLVRERFEESPGGVVTEQSVEAEDRDGEPRTLRNVLLTLPGDADRTIVIVAARDSAHPPGAASSAAATGVLIELANAFRVSHAKTFVLASVSGSTVGAAGIQALVDGLPERNSIESVIVIGPAGSVDPQPPSVVSSSTGTASASVQLERTAELAVEVQAEAAPSSEPGAWTQLARLAIPSGLGDQAPLIADRTDAIAISSAGERPLSADADQLDDLSPRTVDEFGRATQSTVTALDVTVADPVHGPASHLELGDNLVPGWALATLALALILPAAVCAIDSCARARRGELALGGALAWTAARSLPFVGALGALYGLAIVGAIPRPEFPFDPGLYEAGPRAVIVFAAITVVALASAWLLRTRGGSARGAPEAAACALGVVCTAAITGLWLANPYLALLAVPAAHVWLLAARGPRTAGRLLTVAAAAVACVPVLAAAGAVAAALDLGPRAPWTFTLMVADGQIGLLSCLAACFIAGCLAGATALALRRDAGP